MVPFFNISSAGASATLWLNNLLNEHPNVVAMHALRDDPFDGEPLSPTQMVAGLLDLNYRVRGMRTFGVVHSYYGTELYDEIKAAGGSFMAIVRHPVSRIHSLFSHHYRDIAGNEVRDGDVYQTIRDDGRVREMLQLFEGRVKDTLLGDLQNMTVAQQDEIAVFEQMTGEADYCREKLETLLDIDLSDLVPSIERQLGNKHNQHVAARRTADEIFDQWPQPYRECFQNCATNFGLIGVRDTYRRHGYEVADMLIG